MQLAGLYQGVDGRAADVECGCGFLRREQDPVTGRNVAQQLGVRHFALLSEVPSAASGRPALPGEGARRARLMTRGSDELIDGELLRTRTDGPCADEGACGLTPTLESTSGVTAPE
jgi:hypothetical protein